MYNEKHNVLFIHIPKNAGTTVTYRFFEDMGYCFDHEKLMDGKYNGKIPDVVFGKLYIHPKIQFATHATLQEYYDYNFLPHDVIDNAIKVAVVRHPFDRLWSEYLMGNSDHYKWNDFLKLNVENKFKDKVCQSIGFNEGKAKDLKRHTMPQNEFIDDSVEIIKYENFEEDFQNFLNKHSIKLDYTDRNSKVVNQYPRYFNPCHLQSDYATQLDIMKKNVVKYKQDFIQFNYKIPESLCVE